MADPTDSSGLLGGLMNSPLFYAGLGLMANSGYGGTVGGGLLQGLGAYQQQRAANVQNQMQQLELARQRMIYGLQAGAIGQGQGQQPTAPQPGLGAVSSNAAAAMPGLLAGTPAAPTAPPPSAPAPSMFSPVPSDELAATQVPGGLPPAIARAFAFADPKTANAQLDAYAKAQQAEQQRLHANALSQTAGLATGKIPISTLRAKGNEEVLGYFEQEAKAQGLDLGKDADARQVAMILHNRLGGSIGAPDVQAVLPMVNSSQGGVQYQTQPETQKTDMIPQPRMYPTAAGYQPSATAQGKLPASEIPTIAANKAAAVAGATAPIKNVSAVVQDYQHGPTSKTLDGLNTAIGHMAQMRTAVNAINNGDVRVLNSIGNFFGTQFGSNKQTNLDIVKSFAAGEVAKATIPGGGGEGERQQIANAIASASSPAQLTGALDKWAELLSGKMGPLQQRWDSATKGTQGSFAQFTTPETQGEMQAAAARVKAAQGNQPPKPPQLPQKSKGLAVGASFQRGNWTVTKEK